MPSIGANSYGLNLIGGFNICEKKSIFSLDGKFVFTISNNSIRIYIIASGLPYGVLTTDDKSSKSGEEIVTINLNPISPDTSLISFSSRGRILIWNHLKLELVREYDLFDSLYYQCGKALQLIWGQVILTDDAIESGNLHFYYAMLVDQEPGMFFSSVDEISRCLNELPSNKKKSSKDTKELKQRTLQRLTDERIPIKYDSSRPYVSITIGSCNKFLAAIDNNQISIILLPHKNTTRGLNHIISRNYFTCITSHPKELLLAAGDSIGRIYIYRDNFLTPGTPIRSVSHWHHSPVNDLCFSSSAAYLYSGGYECVIVRWDSSMKHSSNYLPRIGGPIRYISCDTVNEKIMTCHFDNSIQFASTNLDSMTSSVDGLYLMPRENFLQSFRDICYDLRSNAVVMRGKCGHLQFFSPSQEKHLFSVDIVNMNYLPPEADKLIINVDIDRFAVSDDGAWIATLEMRDDGVTLLEIRLKFWEYKEDSDKKYSLNTSIHLPHKKRLNCMRFASNSKNLVTTSQDGCFKIWYLTKDPDRVDSNHFWISQRVGEIGRGLIPDRIAMSEDFSILAISSYNKTLLWDSSNILQLDLKGTLLSDEEHREEKLTSIEFGGSNRSHLLCETRETSFRTWDLLTLSINNVWQPPNNLRIKFSVFHRATNYCAIFLSSGTLFIHKLGEDFIRVDLNPPRNDINLRLIVQGIFIPQNNKQDELFSEMGLCLVDENQQIFSLGLVERDDIMERDMETEEEIESNLTPYARMLLEEKNKIKIQDRLDQLEVNQYLGHYQNRRKLVEEMFINVPSYVLPPVESIATSFLSMLLQPGGKENDNDTPNNSENRSAANQIEPDQDSRSKRDEKLMEVESEELEKPTQLVFNENYDWLGDYLPD
ncbi:WD repeat-containing protein l(2)05287 [Brevipalpus obovatus]|uniref:WD repeat-containing protein l(2)05287 n=1 Tax=Brevipalpus obovatus TaxID=246614 RepID=UPI003D9E7F80